MTQEELAEYLGVCELSIFKWGNARIQAVASLLQTIVPVAGTGHNNTDKNKLTSELLDVWESGHGKRQAHMPSQLPHPESFKHPEHIRDKVQVPLPWLPSALAP